MSLLWLRFALACYFIGLVYAFVALTRTSDLFSRIALHAASLGMVFHFVSLAELFLSGQVVWASVHNGESLLAFFSMTFFMIIYAIYQTTSPGVVVFPIVFFLTFVARRRRAAGAADHVRFAQGMADRPHHPHLHRIRRAGAQLRRQPALSAAGAPPEGQEIHQPDFVPARARSDRPDRLPLAAAGLSLHDAGPADRHRSSPLPPTAAWISSIPRFCCRC